MNRREFISRLSLLGAGIALAPAIVAKEVIQTVPNAVKDYSIVWIEINGHRYWYFKSQWEAIRKFEQDSRAISFISRNTYKHTGLVSSDMKFLDTTEN